jgi:aspartate carbamoyltransferase catalytic subunit
MNNDDSLAKIANNFTGKDIVSLDQFDTSSIETVLKTTQTVSKQLQKGKVFDVLKGTISTLIFFEPSSRTFSSFAAAIKRLGGGTIEYQNPMQTSSAVKGETLEDAIRVFEAYSDLIVMRHPEVGAARRAAAAAKITPIMNAGDGPGEHPTQAMLDMYTIYEKFGRLDNLNILFGGDILYGRTVHSLMKGLAMFPNNTVYLLSPKQLKISDEYKKEFMSSRHTEQSEASRWNVNKQRDPSTPLRSAQDDRRHGLKIVEIESETDMPKDADVWYWTRVQKERFKDLKEYEKIKNAFIITPELLKKKGNKDMIILHPLPRVGEIDVRVDTDPRAWYLPRQVKNGMYVRMALVGLVLGKI